MSLNPNYTQTITVYHKSGNAWNRAVYTGCFFQAKEAVGFSSTQAALSNTYIARIPESVAGTGFAVSLDDIVILGECTDLIDDKAAGHRSVEVLRKNKPFAFKVTAVSNNTQRLMDRHWRLGG